MENPARVDEQPAPARSRRGWLAAGAIVGVMVVAAVGLYAWYAVYGPCSRRAVSTASEALFEQVYAFEAAYQAAASSTPVGLMGPVTQMQQTLWDTRDVAVPSCMQPARDELVTAMESAIRAFLAIMNDEPGQTVQDLLQESQAHLENFTTELDAVTRCAPFCLLNTSRGSTLADSGSSGGLSTRHRLVPFLPSRIRNFTRISI